MIQRSEYVYLGIELPCDVRIPPNTLISAGCTLGTLLSALELEGRPRKFAAKAIEAQRAETVKQGSVADESAAPKGFAQGDQP